MKTLPQFTASFILAIGARSAQCLVIDDFTTGKTRTLANNQ